MASAANREASTATTSTTSQSSPTSPSSLQSEEKKQQKQQADFAELVQMRHHCVSLCRDSLSWLGHTADALEAECVELCERASGLPKRMENRLSAVCLATYLQVHMLDILSPKCNFSFGVVWCGDVKAPGYHCKYPVHS